MEKTYDPSQIERTWYQTWEKNNYFAPRGEGKPYCIMIPPPNVTGSLHMGHGFQHSLMDALIRYHRMRGFKTLWQPGTDHAGISTQMVVERQLMNEGLTRRELGREKFVERIWQWKEHSGNTITGQIRRLGDSVDWTRERFTLDAGLSNAVLEVFVRLYDEGLIYRGTKLVNWDPVLQTAVSDLEAIAHEEAGHLWHIRYPLSESNDYLVIATTRPETLLGDTAVAVHPDDQRYQHLIGKTLRLPLTDREIPIIADDYVDPTFGSGCVKITPAHDFNDYAVGLRHQLPMINVLTLDGKMNQEVPAVYQGMDRFDARKKILADLEQLGLIVKIDDHKLNLPRGEKSNAILEPMLTQQWFMRMEKMAERALHVVETGKIKFIPENWTKTYNQWLNNIEDWCISRQLWWGHRIPAWYDEHNNIYVGRDEQTIRQKYQLTEDMKLTQDNDVLDTWFSSALWPFSTLGWPHETLDLKTFYPTSLLVTGFDIIFFWVARMIMLGLTFTDEVPFHEVYITGLIRDSEGQKMSKSKGNILDPIDLIDGIDLESLLAKRTANMMQPHLAEKIKKQTRKEFPEGIPAYGTDALRFTFCALATPGREIRFDIQRLAGYRNFCNKIWNAARYVFMNCENQDNGFNDQAKILSVADRWILSRLQHTIANVHDYFQSYRFDLLTQTLYEFIWNEFCDWYLELSKPVLTHADISFAEKRGTRHTLLTVLDQILKLIHPIMPFISEEIWQKVKNLTQATGETIMLESFPTTSEDLFDEAAEGDITWCQAIILGIRNIRGEMNISPAKPITVLLNQCSEEDLRRLQHYQTFLASLAKLTDISPLEKNQTPPPSATALAGKMEILIPLAGLIDTQAEIERLQKSIQKIEKDLEKSRAKLNNKNFVDNAPPDVVAKEQQRVSEMEQAILQLQAQLAKMAGVT
ncbi:MAG: valine--tRNA ligase [Legionellales bacterium]|nr:valine--tRNA ligase [Legionellales bacterium]